MDCFFIPAEQKKGLFLTYYLKILDDLQPKKGTASGSIKIKPIPKKLHKKEPTNKRQPYNKFYAKVGI